MKLAVILGTRPEVIKLAPVINELKRRNADYQVISTGQHKEILSQTLDVFSIAPDISLDVISPGQSLASLGSRILAAIDTIFTVDKYDCVLVQGDTASSFFCALAAFNHGIMVGHVEAGMRTGDIKNPFPEEANRRMISCIATKHFAATQRGKESLIKEGIKADNIFITGNTVVDAINFAKDLLDKNKRSSQLSYLNIVTARPYVLITCHRRENFGEVLEGICSLIRELASNYKCYDWIFPVHPNPNVYNPVMSKLSRIENLKLIAPIDYLTTIDLMRGAELVITDSGGIQEEAPSFSVPVVVMRNATERMEGVYAGFATLAGQEQAGILDAVDMWLGDNARPFALRNKNNPYGDGKAAERIVSNLFGESVCEFMG